MLVKLNKRSFLTCCPGTIYNDKNEKLDTKKSKTKYIKYLLTNLTKDCPSLDLWERLENKIPHLTDIEYEGFSKVSILSL